MSFVIATPELLQGAAQHLAGIGSTLAEASTSVSVPTTAIAAAAEDEISIAIAALFGNFGKQFQSLSTQAQAFHAEFVSLMDSSVGAYASAEIANAQQALLGGTSMTGAPVAAATSVDPVARWEQVFTTTSQNAQKVFGAWDAGVTTFANGVATGFSQLVTNPVAALGNLQTAAQSVFLVGAPSEVTAAVSQHTLGGITQSIGSEIIDVFDVHNQLYFGLMEGFLPEGALGVALAGGLNFAASPFSALLIGAVGPFVAPGVALWNSAGSVFADITGGNLTGALNGLINTPANVVDGFFNGATLNLDLFAPVVNQLFAGPGATEQVTGVSLGFGGLFSPGQVVTGASGSMYEGVGGSMLNALGLHLAVNSDDFVGTLPVPALGVGPIGAAANMFNILGQAVGGNLLGYVPDHGHDH